MLFSEAPQREGSFVFKFDSRYNEPIITGFHRHICTSEKTDSLCKKKGKQRELEPNHEAEKFPVRGFLVCPKQREVPSPGCAPLMVRSTCHEPDLARDYFCKSTKMNPKIEDIRSTEEWRWHVDLAKWLSPPGHVACGLLVPEGCIAFGGLGRGQHSQRVAKRRV